jgi:N-acetylmuramoyl-L-alanine amidase
MKRYYLLFPALLVPAIAYLAQPAPSAPAKARTDDAFTVCIDPGHPSETSDGASANGLSENRLNWQVSQRLAQRLRRLGIRYVVTKRSERERVTNRRRAEIANANRALIFIRLHCDTGSGRGFTWYYPDRAGRKGGVTGPSREVQQWSRSAAQIMNEAMKPVLKGSLRSNPIKTDASTFVGGKQGGVLTGSIFSRVPTALIEMCFINQRADARFIGSAKGQEKMAEALAAGIVSWKRAIEANQKRR